jgi:hypothetical protein
MNRNPLVRMHDSSHPGDTPRSWAITSAFVDWHRSRRVHSSERVLQGLSITCKVPSANKTEHKKIHCQRRTYTFKVCKNAHTAEARAGTNHHRRQLRKPMMPFEGQQPPGRDNVEDGCECGAKTAPNAVVLCQTTAPQ